MQRRIQAVLLAACMVLAMESQAFAEPVAIAWEAKLSPTIDGKLDEWNLSSPIVLEREEQVNKDLAYWEGPDDASARFYVMWDEKNLYLAGQILDDVPFQRFMPFGLDVDIDALALYLSTNPDADPNRILYEPTDFRVLFALDNDMFDTALDRDKVLIKKGIETRGMSGYEAVLKGYEVALVTSPGGYTVEMKVPLANFSSSSLPALRPKAGMKIGFNIELYDLDQACPGSVAPSLSWAPGPNKPAPKYWGTLHFQSGQ